MLSDRWYLIDCRHRSRQVLTPLKISIGVNDQVEELADLGDVRQCSFGF